MGRCIGGIELMGRCVGGIELMGTKAIVKDTDVEVGIVYGIKERL